jgi:large subunit ribosomal protein L7/L12
MEDKFGVTAAPAAVAMAPATGWDAGGEAEKTSFDVELTSAGGQKIAVIKVIKEITGLWLKEAKGIADNGGKVKEGASKDEAEEIKKKLEDAGATAEVK